jgi:hypothetical protein
MPRTIAIAGGGSGIGKTRLAEALAAILGDAAVCKIGERAAQSGKNPLFFPLGTRLAAVVAAAGEREWLVVESGSILDDPGADPELVIFLPAPAGDKPGAARRRQRAHIVRGRAVGSAERAAIRARCGFDEGVLERIIRAVDAASA